MGFIISNNIFINIVIIITFVIIDIIIFIIEQTFIWHVKLILIVISDFLERHSKAKRTRASAYSRVLDSSANLSAFSDNNPGCSNNYPNFDHWACVFLVGFSSRIEATSGMSTHAVNTVTAKLAFSTQPQGLTQPQQIAVNLNAHAPSSAGGGGLVTQTNQLPITGQAIQHPGIYGIASTLGARQVNGMDEINEID